MPLVTNGAPSSVAAVDLRKRRREENGVLMGAKIRTELPELPPRFVGTLKTAVLVAQTVAGRHVARPCVAHRALVLDPCAC